MKGENDVKIKFGFKGIHHCEAVVLTCIDFRFWRETVEFVEKGLGIKSFDFPSLPGAAKTLNESANQNDLAWQCLDVPVKLHAAKKIVIINHEDCGAYGGSKKFANNEAEQKFHEGELKKAKQKILDKYPDKEIFSIYVRLMDEKENLEFLIV
jgi:carbonic anhydrase